jgi:hypothetical protein
MAVKQNPMMPKFVDDFDEEAAKFLRHYKCENAIINPEPIPIREIAEKRMLLDIVETENLSADESVQGAIAFTHGIIEIYDWQEQQYIGYEVSKGTVFVDADIINEGRINNTLAHECYHWYKHRLYFIYRNTHEEGTEFGFRCDNSNASDAKQGVWTDEEKMEYQARTIAPKILMPKIAAKKKLAELYNIALKKLDTLDRFIVTQEVIDKFSEFYCVSKQSAAIRMTELGYPEAGEFYSHDDNSRHKRLKQNGRSRAKIRQQKVSPEAAFEIYLNNESLRSALDTGAFRYVQGYFVLNDEKYLYKDSYGEWHMTDYALSHMSKCTLDFSLKLVSKYSGDFSHRACMFHKDIEYKRLSAFDSSSQNIDAYNQAKALENAAADFEKQFDRQMKFGKTATAKMWEYMQFYNWNTRIFQDKTLLAPMDYTRVQDPNHIFKLPAYTAMAVGLELTLNETKETLRLSGLDYDPNDRTQNAYMYILSTFQGCPIDECNDVLNKLNVPELGTKSRR